MSFHPPGMQAALHMVVTGLDVYVFHPALKFDSLEAEDILLWKGTLKQVHEVFRRERGKHFEASRRSAGLEHGADAGIKPLYFPRKTNAWLRLARPHSR